jgi:hypothetical protein
MFNAAQRGPAMSLFAVAPFLGPSIGPIVGLHHQVMSVIDHLGRRLPLSSLILEMGRRIARFLRSYFDRCWNPVSSRDLVSPDLLVYAMTLTI